MKKYLLIFITITIALTGCEDQFNPIDENLRSFEDIYNNPVFGEAYLMNAYSRIPTNSNSFNDVATDNAVTNDNASNYLIIATGAWTSINNPLSQWDNSFTAIMYLNKFLAEVDNVIWSYRDDKVRELYSRRHKGEAHALRALFMYYLLKHHAGEGPDGTLLGVPIYTEPFDTDTDFRNKPRNTFAECVQQIYLDIEEASMHLPLDYGNVQNANNIPAMYSDYNMESYNRVFGDLNRQRISGRIAEGIKAKTALLAASPAFNKNNDIQLWEEAANSAATVLNRINGISGLDPVGDRFFTNVNIDRIRLAIGRDQLEMLWRTSLEGAPGSRWRQESNYPPSLFGDGRVNPSQNLVDAFPCADGYPIDHVNSIFDPEQPYVNRDPRLQRFVIHDGSTFAGRTIYTREENTIDGIEAVVNSTRTGYYLRKLMREDVSVEPGAIIDRRHYNVHIRYTEIFLIYAEAANEAWGPNGRGGNAYSAKEVIAAIRQRAGITQPDDYLTSINDQEAMRELIRNERRLELSFEGFRFWDLRRWNQNLNEPVKGVRITHLDGTNQYNYIEVERREFDNHMIYGPIPYDEVLKANLVQNKGW
jgi:starch-binding outer membrane protein, SusD/RagB family